MSRFDCFVVFAEMRTGSNLLEAALNALPGVTCHGEAFNPVLIGFPDKTALLGLTQAERDADPLALWSRIKAAKGLNGCRFFHDHDPRMLPVLLEDPRCAKIVLTRNPVESYVSLMLARATGQWKLGDAKYRKATPLAEFDAAEFEAHLQSLQGFQITLMRALQTSGQTAFYIDYEDAQDLAVLNGLAAWLGVEGRLTALPTSLVVQNPGALEDKVANFPAMAASLAKIDRFNLSRTPNFEPRRGPGVPGFVGCDAGLLYLPIRPELEAPIRDWLAKLGPLESDFSQKTLRQWKRRHPGHRSFTVVRHPLLRAHLAFAALLSQDGMLDTRAVLRRSYKLPLPPEGKPMAPQDWAAGLLAFLGWLKANLNAQTSLAVHPLWASQSASLQGIAQVAPPDLVAREDRLAEDLAALAQMIGVPAPAFDPPQGDTAPVKLADVWTPELEQAAAETYSRDYMQFGFGPWKRKKG
ncbi:sulfotransferase domain-containing protein [Rhodobacter capsulatus]|uniref:Sulfotransferase domain-containing protein n=1 Tax=Rhodobacter capsulatus TaxID=1061 RepID=A0A4U1K2Z0_RHOCA|nr:sulfotransferase domain-containing protein [Rhodobacter capsulatus]TKD26246.1 sulfotransferase domain-containing protein [Rhodobacter capsulatus]